jgi:hypothetical protein
MGHMAGSINKNRISLHKEYKSWDAINGHVKAGRLTLVGTLHSYCMAGYECQMHKVSSPVTKRKLTDPNSLLVAIERIRSFMPLK